MLLGAFLVGVAQLTFARMTVPFHVFILRDFETFRTDLNYAVYVDGTRFPYVQFLRAPGNAQQGISIVGPHFLHKRKFVLELRPRWLETAGPIYRFEIEIPSDWKDCDLVIDFRQPTPTVKGCDFRFEES